MCIEKLGFVSYWWDGGELDLDFDLGVYKFNRLERKIYENSIDYEYW